MINLSQKNPKKQGDVGMGVAIGWFAANGYTVSVPLTDSQEYDLVVDDGCLKSVQVKSTRFQKNGKYEVELRTSGGNRSGTGITKNLNKELIDLLFVVVENGDLYLIPISKLDTVTKLTLGAKYEKFKISWVSIQNG